ncbi:MAG: acyl-CoA synthetase [Deltaproteobacteria bacterium]|nr:acyl-CoA synthetase [Deltaproteobacteria bacterium]
MHFQHPARIVVGALPRLATRHHARDTHPGAERDSLSDSHISTEISVEFDFARTSEAIAAALPDRLAIIFRDRRIRYAELAERSRRLASHLHACGLGVQRKRAALPNHESGQDHLAIYLYNGNEYIESMLGAFKARVAPLNVNYRYVEEELLYLFQNSGSRAVVYHAEFAPRLAAIRDRLPNLEVLIQVEDESGHALLPGAIPYEEALANGSPGGPGLETSPDDLYILYTGGTTGMPKGVLWRSADIYPAAMGGRKLDGKEFESIEEVAAFATAGAGMKSLCGPPLMHGAAQWGAFINFGMGNTVVFANDARKLDPVDFLSTIEREGCNTATIVGDAFARPILDEIKRGDYDLKSLFLVASGGAPLSTANKQEFLDQLPNLTIMDAIGSSETGAQATNPSNKASGVSTGSFKPGVGACVVSEDMRRVLEPGSEEIGWFAQKGHVPLGYLGDPRKSGETFPSIDGTRYSVPGDRALHHADGIIEVLGRDSVTINSGGEKIFAEEVEHALKLHSDVFDCVVAGRPSERWGQEVVAVVQLREGARASEEDLLAEAGQHIARYKLPKAFVFRDAIQRSPSGKADYRWAREEVGEQSGSRPRAAKIRIHSGAP